MNKQLFIPQVILMDKETGKPFEVNLQSIDPWPPEPIEKEPEQPMVFNQTFNVKLSKKDSLAFKRMLRRQTKLPRKLKKASKHIIVETPMVVAKRACENSHRIYSGLCFFTINGYPYTKWVQRVIGLIEYKMRAKRAEAYKDIEAFVEEEKRQGNL